MFFYRDQNQILSIKENDKNLVQKYYYRNFFKSVNIFTWLNKMHGDNSINKFNFVKTLSFSIDLTKIKKII
jgi:hypothetical protein